MADVFQKTLAVVFILALSRNPLLTAQAQYKPLFTLISIVLLCLYRKIEPQQYCLLTAVAKTP